MAYYQVEPFGEERADLRAGIVASTLININRRKGTKMSKPTDFLLFKATPDLQSKALSELLKAEFKKLPVSK